MYKIVIEHGRRLHGNWIGKKKYVGYLNKVTHGIIYCNRQVECYVTRSMCLHLIVTSFAFSAHTHWHCHNKSESSYNIIVAGDVVKFFAHIFVSCCTISYLLEQNIMLFGWKSRRLFLRFFLRLRKLPNAVDLVDNDSFNVSVICDYCQIFSILQLVLCCVRWWFNWIQQFCVFCNWIV